MELTPQDLGNERYVSILTRRLTIAPANGQAQQPSEPHPRRRRRRGTWMRSRMRRSWVRGLDLEPEVSEEVAEVTARGTPGVSMKVGMVLVSIYMFLGAILTAGLKAPPFIPLMFLTIWACTAFALINAPRKALKQAHDRALTVQEVETLLPTARGRLERTYLNLVLDAMRQEVPTESARADIRSALRHLGDAISRLPADPVSTQDPTSLRAEALGLRQQAAAEHDSFIAASLNRQAENLEQRAALTAQNSRAARRTAVLRREVRAQMDSLRSVLVAYGQMDEGDLESAGLISQALHRVSGEAQSLTLAQRELEDEEMARLLGMAPTAAEPVVEPAVAPSHRVQVTPSDQPTQQPQTVSARQWWQGENIS